MNICFVAQLRMILYHNTKLEFLPSIFRYGLTPTHKEWCVYLAPTKNNNFGEVTLEVETNDLKLTAFDECKSWEILCWGYIPPENIKLV